MRSDSAATLTAGFEVDHATATWSGPTRMRAAPAGYDLFRFLGGGGMGDVYLAREHAAERTVAMKFLRLTANATTNERFLTEVRALGRLDHPNIVRIIAVDLDRGDPYYTMEYAAAGTLSDRIKTEGPLEPEAAARMCLPLARAVEAAHEAQVLHRDIKPSNVILAADGTPKLSDFGLAKLVDHNDELTRTTQAVGTPAFMPPEQISRKLGEFGPATDVYGLGATLYSMLTGKAPFEGDSNEDIISKVRSESPPRPRSLRPEIPLSLEAVVLKCLEKRPADRYASCDALARDLEKCVAGEQPAAPAMTRGRRARRWMLRNASRIAVSIVLLAAAAYIAASLSETDRLLTAEQVHDRLRAGKSVTLVDANVIRVATSWGMSPCELGPSRFRDTNCSFQTRGTAILTLVPNTGIERYRVRAELRQDMKLGDADGISTETGRVGVAIGHARLPLQGDSSIQSLWLVGFREFPDPVPAPAPDLRITVFDLNVFEQPLLSSWHQQAHGRTVKLTPREGEAPPWRAIEIDVEPDRVVVRHDGLEAVETAETLNRRRSVLQSKIRTGWTGASDATLPLWGPPRSVGLVADSCWLSARNVIIEPLK